jgi:hypothetical protein
MDPCSSPVTTLLKNSSSPWCTLLAERPCLHCHSSKENDAIKVILRSRDHSSTNSKHACAEGSVTNLKRCYGESADNFLLTYVESGLQNMCYITFCVVFSFVAWWSAVGYPLSNEALTKYIRIQSIILFLSSNEYAMNFSLPASWRIGTGPDFYSESNRIESRPWRQLFRGF